MKPLLFSTCLVVSTLMSPSIFANTFKLVVTHNDNTSVKSKSIAGLRSVHQRHSGLSVIEVEAVDLQAAIAKVSATGQYKTIEPDVVITKINPPKPVPYLSTDKPRNRMTGQNLKDVPSDPEFAEQWYWLPQSTVQTDQKEHQYLGQSNLIPAYQSVVYNKKPRVGIVDSGFYQNDDLTYSEDSFSLTTEFEETRRPNFYGDEDQELCQFAHGTSIAGIIAAEQNNGVGIAGIADAEIVAVRAMKCGIGTLSDVADAIYYLAGKPDIQDVPEISKKVDVINLSLGGPADTCPSYIQGAIDYAVANQVVVMTTANNDSAEAKDYTPSNCNNVVVVGAVDRQGKKAPFSNTGPEVDLVAAGVDVVAPGPYGEMYWWEGTSQALPIVTGLAALAKAEFPDITPKQVEMMLKLTTSNYAESSHHASTSCSNFGCGTGVVNGENFITTVRNFMNENTGFISHALAEQNSCTMDIFTEYFDKTKNLCDQFALTFIEGPEHSNQIEYQLYQVPNGLAFNKENGKLLLQTHEPSVSIKDIDIEQYNYGFSLCFNGQCEASLFELDQSNANVPLTCR